MGFKFKIALSLALLVGDGSLLSVRAQTGNCVISGGINNGIQIQNCPVVQAAPTPTFHVVQFYPIKKNDNGTFSRSALIQVDAPYVPNNMIVLAKGATVTDINVSNKTMMFGGSGTLNSIHMYGVTQPSGEYTVTITTSDSATDPSMEVQFNAPNINWNGPRP
jgi:hypothetical protein